MSPIGVDSQRVTVFLGGVFFQRGTLLHKCEYLDERQFNRGLRLTG